MSNENTVQVWDILIRVFHWTLVAFFIIAYFTAEEENILHIYSGYTVLGLIIFRLIWGLIGTKYARFSNFVYSPFVVIEYLKSLLEKQPKHYIGHNPVGGYMVVALILSLLVVTVSGLKLYAVEEGLGPLAAEGSGLIINYAHANEKDDDDHDNEGVNEQEEEFWEDVHEVSTNFTLFFIFLAYRRSFCI